MLQPSPEHHNTLELDHAIELKSIRLEQRRMKRQKRVFSALTAVALIGAHVAVYASDVRQNQEIQASASIDVNFRGEALDSTNNDNALVFIDGFGSYNADKLTKYMGPAIQPVLDGQLWSIDYNNAALESKEIAKQIISTAVSAGTTSLSIIGYSAGGDIAMQVQQQIRENSDLAIEAIFLISTPDGAEALRPPRKNEVAVVEQYSWIPGVEYSTPLRAIGEMAFRASQYDSENLIERAGQFIETAHDVTEALDNDKLPGTWLMFDQMLAIENARIESRIQKIGELPEAALCPTIVYLGTARPGYDYMVDDTMSSDNIKDYAEAANVPFYSYDVPGAVHSMVDIAHEEYVSVLQAAGPEIIRSVTAQKYSSSLLTYQKNLDASEIFITPKVQSPNG
ncbi:hypothetical protein H7200_01720 [Candidatus Saccharibacteria bacterium]|nr:hypothetical protein [Candidatus Saccharibacteria bacterium]